MFVSVVPFDGFFGICQNFFCLKQAWQSRLILDTGKNLGRFFSLFDHKSRVTKPRVCPIPLRSFLLSCIHINVQYFYYSIINVTLTMTQIKKSFFKNTKHCRCCFFFFVTRSKLIKKRFCVTPTIQKRNAVNKTNGVEGEVEQKNSQSEPRSKKTRRS